MSRMEAVDDSMDHALTRRNLLGLASVAGVSLFSSTAVGTGRAATGDPLYVDGSNAMEADLDLGGHAITSVDDGSGDLIPIAVTSDLDLDVNSVTGIDNVEAGHDYSSFNSSGTGNGHLQLFDTNANSYHLRTFEGAEAADGETEPPGHVEFQAPIMGAREDRPGTPDPGPLRIEHGTVTDSVSVRNWNLVDVVAEPAIDETADLGAQIQNYLNDLPTIDHLFVVPTGSYTWNTAVDQDEFEFVGVVGEPKATLEVQTNDADVAFDLGHRNGGAKRATVQNLTVDISGTDADGDDIDAGLVVAHAEKSLKLENLELQGQRHKLQSNETKQGNRFTVLSQLLAERGVGRITDVTLADGDVPYSDEESVGHAIPFSADPAHEGTNFWNGCYVEGFVDNGFYVQNSPGRNVLTGCFAKNNSGGNIRLGPNDVCHDSTVIIDEPLEHNARGLFLKGDNWDGQPPCAENVTIDAPNTVGGAPIRMKDAGGEVRNVELVHGVSDTAPTAPPAIKVTGDGPATIENVTVNDVVDYSQTEDESRGFSVFIDRPGTTVRDLDLTIESATDLREGIAIASRFVRLDGCHVSVPNGGDTVEVRENENSFVDCRVEGTTEENAQFTAYSSLNSDSLHVHGCRFTDVDLVNLTRSDVSEENFYRET